MDAICAELPRYKCHKEVHALKIARAEQVVRASDGAVTGYSLHFEDPGYAPITVSSEWARRTDSALAGGYYVVYEDGYTSYSPAAAFESGYTSLNGSAATEAQIAAVSTAPRVTPADIEANIAGEHYFTAAEAAKCPEDVALKLLTFCVLILRNGFTVTGESACASPENFNAEIGRRIARTNAEQKVWSLMGYELRTVLMRQGRV